MASNVELPLECFFTEEGFSKFSFLKEAIDITGEMDEEMDEKSNDDDNCPVSGTAKGAQARKEDPPPTALASAPSPTDESPIAKSKLSSLTAGEHAEFVHLWDQLVTSGLVHRSTFNRQTADFHKFQHYQAKMESERDEFNRGLQREFKVDASQLPFMTPPGASWIQRVVDGDRSRVSMYPQHYSFWQSLPLLFPNLQKVTSTMTAKQVLLTWGRVARVTAPAVEQCLDVAGDLRLPCVSSAPLHADTVLHSLLAKHDVHAGLTARAFKQLLKMQQEETMVPIRVQAAGDGALVQVIVDDPLPTPTASMRHLGELYARHVLLQALDDGWQPLHDDRHAADPSPAADPTSGHADPQPSPCPVDSILHEQTKTLNDRRTTAHAPLACGTEPAPLGIEPATGDNVIYTLWQDGALNVLVRSTHGVLLTAAKKSPKPPSPPPTSVAIVHAKLEYQSHEGCEQLTFTELSDAWADCFLARNTAPLLRVRMDAATLRVMHMEHLPAEHVLPNQTPFRPNMAMKNLHLLLDRLRSFPAGDYLLRRQLDESHVTILKATPTGKGSFDLRATTGATTGVTATAKAVDPTAVFWIPIDPNIVLDRHRATGRLPCTFVARPAESSAFGMTLRSRKESPQQAAGKKRKKKKKGKVKRA